jgi:hypothetical protein
VLALSDSAGTTSTTATMVYPSTTGTSRFFLSFFLSSTLALVPRHLIDSFNLAYQQPWFCSFSHSVPPPVTKAYVFALNSDLRSYYLYSHLCFLDAVRRMRSAKATPLRIDRGSGHSLKCPSL